MEFILSSSRVKEVEKNVIDNIGIPASVLMERAAESVFEFIVDHYPDPNTNVLVVCGNGNNGADGLCLARIFAEKSYKPDVYEVSGNKSDLYVLQKSAINTINESFGEKVRFVKDTGDNDKYDLIVDALFGIGINRELSFDYCNLISNLNNHLAIKISIDIPSGLNATSGQIMGASVIADYTICLGVLKTGLYFNDGPNVSGKVIFSDIGFWYKPDLKKDYCCLNEDSIKNIKILNRNNAHKGTYGKTLVIAGSESIYGACLFSAKTAIKAGAGMVKVITHKANREVLYSDLPEALYDFYDSWLDSNIIDMSLEWADTVVVGPGLSISKTSVDIVNNLISSEFFKNKIVVIDADGLNILAGNKDLFLVLLNKINNCGIKCVLTPHKKELERLINGLSDLETKEEFIDSLAGDNLVIIDKDCKSRVYGSEKYINISGNDGMATAGSGDVLSGLLGGLLFRLINDNSLAKSTAVCTYLHGALGDEYVKQNNKYSLTASDLTEYVTRVVDFLT